MTTKLVVSATTPIYQNHNQTTNTYMYILLFNFSATGREDYSEVKYNILVTKIRGVSVTID